MLVPGMSLICFRLIWVYSSRVNGRWPVWDMMLTLRRKGTPVGGSRRTARGAVAVLGSTVQFLGCSRLTPDPGSRKRTNAPVAAGAVVEGAAVGRGPVSGVFWALPL